MSAIVDIYALSPLQEGILFHTLYDSQDEYSSAYINQLSLLLLGPLDVGIFAESWNHLVQKHDIFRTVFVWENIEQPVQAVYENTQFTLKNEDWTHLSQDEQVEELKKLMEVDRFVGFQLDEAPLMRVTIINEAEDKFRLVVTYHHLLLDGWSSSLILYELLNTYKNIKSGKLLSLVRPPSYEKYIRWIKEQDHSQAEKFWREELKGFSAPTPLGISNRFAIKEIGFAESVTLLTREQTQALEKWAKMNQLTLNTLFQGAWSYLLSRYSGDNDVVYGVTSSGRPANLNGVEKMIGLFINTLPTRVSIPDHITILEWLQGIQNKELIRREYEYTSLTNIQGWSEVPRGTPMFHTLYVYENYPMTSFNDNLGFEIVDMKREEQTNYPLSLVVVPGERISIQLMYDKGKIDSDSILRIQGHLKQVLSELIMDKDRTLSEIVYLTPEEKMQLFEEWNSVSKPYLSNDMIHRQFEKQAAARPDAVAVVFEKQELTYAKLNNFANQLAHYLRKRGVGPETLVGICMERSVDMVIGILGILKAGGAYVPLDPTNPQQRLQYIIKDSEIKLILSQLDSHSWLSDGVDIISMNNFRELISHESIEAPTSEVKPDQLAYIIYTSGSTGNPKGVMVEHRNVVRLFHATEKWFHFNEDDVWTLFHSYAFDFSVWEIFGALLYGGRLVVVPYLTSRSPEEFYQLLLQEKVTVLNQTPSAFKQLTQVYEAYNNNSVHMSLRYVIFGGEALEASSLLPWFKKHNEGSIQFVNMYGITETTVHVTYYPVTKYDVEHGLNNVIGRPIPDLQLYVLDSDLKPVAVGIAGELYVGGAGVARGYLNRTDLTSERFIDHQIEGKYGGRLYRTGDIVKYTCNGDLEYIGRADTQVKIRGFRIELGEIEAALIQHPEVKQAIVLVREDQIGDKYLVAYVCGSGDPLSWKEHIKALLPSYMVPAYLVKLEGMVPLTSNGKVDTAALFALQWQVNDNQVTAPRGHSEQLVASIWSQVLGIEDIGCYDSFFELGGHSLLATQVVSRLRESFDVNLQLRELFEHSTVERLANRITELRKGEGNRKLPILQSRVNEGGYPLSYAQQRLWFLEQFEPNSALYNIPSSWHLTGKWDIEAIQHSIHTLIKRHEVLRTIVKETDGTPLQFIQAHVPTTWDIKELQHLSKEARELELKRLTYEEANTPFNLEAGPLFRMKWIQMDKEEWIFLCTMHHIISDGWSMNIFIKELTAIYDENVHGIPSLLSAPTVKYADFATWQQEWLKDEILEDQLLFWKEQLAGELPVLQLPTDYVRPSQQSYKGAVHHFLLPKSLVSQLKSVGREQNCTLFMTLLAAYQAFLSRYTGQMDIIVGSPIANRNHREIEEVMGLFVNTLVYRADLSNAPTFKALLANIQKMALQVHDHQDVPFEKIVEALQPERSMSHSPIFQTMFNWQTDFPVLLEFTDRQMEWMATSLASAKFDLTVTMGETEQGLYTAFEYNTDIFELSTIKRMSEHFGYWLQQVATNPELPLRSLELMSSDAMKQMLEDWNNNVIEYPKELLLHELIDAQAISQPDGVALVFGDMQLTYKVLQERSNNLAHYLKKKGVGPEFLVGICMERSLEMVVGLLGVLKAGGAYVPLDPTYPIHRLQYMVQDAGIKIVIAPDHLTAWLPEGTEIVSLNREEYCSNSMTTVPESKPALSNAAYVIYTSGSTGNPKGVVVEHGNLLNFMFTMKRRLTFNNKDTWLACTSISFDISILELFYPLVAGGTVVIASQEEISDGHKLVELIEDSSATYMQATPMMWHLLLDSGYVPSTSLTVLVGGEALSEVLAEALTQGGGQVFNMFGPTESTIWSTMWKVDPGQAISIGRPICNTDVYVLDANLQPMPIGTVGELYIGGAGVARGYLNHPQLTADRFIGHPFSSQNGARLYRTGDLVKYLDNGNLEYIGRMDHQVKVKGFRIELGEIEALLSKHPSVKQVVVIVRDNENGGKWIVAYVVGDGDAKIWRRYVKEHLPYYMVPSHFVNMETLPVTPNGKINRNALPAVDFQRTEEGYIAPSNAKERVLTDIWEQVLGISNISIDDNFFEHGGDSIISTKVISLANKAGLQLSLKQLFEHQTIAELALVAKQSEPAPLMQGEVTGEIPLTLFQYRFFKHDYSHLHRYYQSVMLLPCERLDVNHLRKAFQHIVDHHDALRLRYEMLSADKWIQIHNGTGQEVPLEIIKLDGTEKKGWDQEIKQKIQEQEECMDLQTGPLLRAIYFDEGEASSGRLFIMIHQLVVDEVSWRIFIEDLQTAYSQLNNGERIKLPVKSTSFKEWAESVTDLVQASNIDDVEIKAEQVIVSAVDEDQTNKNDNQITVLLSEVETKTLLQDALAMYKANMSELLLASMVSALYEYTKKSSMIIHLQDHERMNTITGVDITRTIGCFARSYPVQLNLLNASTPVEVLKCVKESIRRLPNGGTDTHATHYRRHDIAVMLLQEHEPLISLNYFGQFDKLIASNSLFMEQFDFDVVSHNPESSNSIDVNGLVIDNKLLITWKCGNHQWSPAIIEAVAKKMLEHLKLFGACSFMEAAYTVSDFADADLSEKSLNKFLNKLSKKRGRK
ncbi:amino acid adenylation domain-containing protein [Paenibacillus sp. ACRRX]|uniref:non-ribosomal peptide synthetase n=1 Tax=Paenibacillus sp. ACRRX TaxID=2918206 RepID=UPI001EF6153F|nr:non-ribosomal peptide synthetase [Paenibacillus sp. ACRRX]MCG7410808.1 amino acid adenylation domain-containing protein [Paenibacillus sp. ACRRX]